MEPRGPRLCRVPPGPAPGHGPAHTCLRGSHTGVRGSHTGVRGSPTGVCGSHIRAGSEVGPGRFRSTLGAGDAGPHFQCHFGHERAKNSTPRDVNHGKFITVSSRIVLDTSRRLGRTFFSTFFSRGHVENSGPGFPIRARREFCEVYAGRTTLRRAIPRPRTTLRRAIPRPGHTTAGPYQ